jgi:hypothetical protein
VEDRLMRREFEEAIDSHRSWKEKEDATLRAAYFEATEDGLWRKSGVLFGKGAALQNAEHELHHRKEAIHS